MDYEKKYKEALERAKEFYILCKKCGAKDTIDFLEDNFPELCESEDEKIRKDLIAIFKGEIPYTSEEDAKRYIAWIEKQGEQKPTDKVEPKFKVGDWITNGDYTWEITEITVLDYVLRAQNGNIVDDTISYTDEQFNLWTIADAKDGDVLVFKNNISGTIICKSPTYYDTKSYCRLVSDNLINKEESGWNSTLLVPATKEQRDLLFQKMHEAGYEWDAEKKELKKFHVIDEGKDEMDYCFTKMMNGEKVSTAWSETEELYIAWLIEHLYGIEDKDKQYENKCRTIANWLKSLKERVGE